MHDARTTEFISPLLMRKIGRTNFKSPTFKKLFSHETWMDYTGLGPWARWQRMLLGWTGSSLLRAVLPRVLFVSAWAALVTLLGRRLPMSPVALQLQDDQSRPLERGDLDGSVTHYQAAQSCFMFHCAR